MLKKTWLTVCLFTALSSGAQDTTRLINHEVGFNALSLLQQVRIFTVTPGQLPYDIFYNIYYRDLVGIRLGLGILNGETLTQVEGQKTPRSTTSKKQNMRAGVSYNVLRTKRFAVNIFADGFLQENSITSSNTFTTQVFPDPVVTRTVQATDESFGGGVQGGFGLKFNMAKHLSLYTEVPIIYTSESHLIEDFIAETGEPEIKSKTLTQSSGTRIALPVTVYLVLRF